jgi:cysteine synthase B
MGLARYFREKKPKVRIVGVEPTLGHTIQGLKNMHESIVPKIYREENLDEKIVIEDGEAFERTNSLPKKRVSSWACPAGQPWRALCSWPAA